ncbi:MAG: hypothetical protein IKU25_05205 [Clostridia bacterium]|nr:hypothetical protein [Clostridia bacterium]
MDKFEKIKDVIEEMDDAELVYIWNEYCDAANRFDDRIERMDEITELFDTRDADGVLNMLNRFYFGSDCYNENGSANPNRDYFVFNGYGNIESTDFPRDFVDVDELAEYITEHGEDFSVDEIADVLNEDEDEDENDEDEEKGE